jgi:hypothetical protein
MRNALVVIVLFASVGCVPRNTATNTLTGSSRSILGPRRSGAITARPEDDTAREVTHLFAERGFTLVDQHVDAPDGERLLKFSRESRYWSSVFYAWIAPMPSGSTASLLGKTSVAGLEPCTDDGVALPCTPVEDMPAYTAGYFTGENEAEIAHGVLAELELAGYAIAPLPADAPIPTGDPAALACKAERHRQLVEAVATPDPDAKRSILDHLPRC